MTVVASGVLSFVIVLLSWPAWAAAPTVARHFSGPKAAAALERWSRPCWSALLLVGPAWFALLDIFCQLTFSPEQSLLISVAQALDGAPPSPAPSPAGAVLRWLLLGVPLLGVWLSLRLARRWGCGPAGPALLVAVAPWALLVGLLVASVEPRFATAAGLGLAGAGLGAWSLRAWTRVGASQPPAAAGVDLGSLATVVPGSTCRICGERICGDAVSCGTCATPHHRACWDWNGGCATYACGGRRAD